MSLVSYGFSDSDISEDETEERNVSVSENTVVNNTDNDKVSHKLSPLNDNIFSDGAELQQISGLFSSLPLPKTTILKSDIKEENDEYLTKSEKVTEMKTRTKVKISVPSVVEYDSDDEQHTKKIKLVTATKSTGLFAILPPPKVAKTSTTTSTKFIPKSVTVKKNKESEKLKVLHPEKDDNETSGHFFSSIFTQDKSVVETHSSSQLKGIQVDSAKHVQNVNSKTNQYFSSLLNSTSISTSEEKSMDNVASGESLENSSQLSEEAYKELCGKRRKKGKKGTAKKVEMIDLDASDIMPDPRDWMTKALTEENPHTSAVKKGDEPSLQHRRKHQITYLAYQAKVNEQDLKNQWAMNRMSRKQTQAKYGF